MCNLITIVEYWKTITGHTVWNLKMFMKTQNVMFKIKFLNYLNY